MPTLAAELKMVGSGFLMGFGEYCEERQLPDSDVHTGLFKAAAAFPEVAEELQKAATLGLMLRGAVGAAAKAAPKAIKGAVPLADDAAKLVAPVTKAVPAAVKAPIVDPLVNAASKAALPPPATPRLPTAKAVRMFQPGTKQLANPLPQGSMTPGKPGPSMIPPGTPLPPAGSGPLRGGGAGGGKLNIPTPTPSSTPTPRPGSPVQGAAAMPAPTVLSPVPAPAAGPINPWTSSVGAKPAASPYTPPTMSPADWDAANPLKHPPMSGATPPPPVAGSGNPWASASGGAPASSWMPPGSGLGGVIPPVTPPAAGPGGWGQMAKQVGTNAAIGAGTAGFTSGGDLTSTLTGGAMGAFSGTKGQATMMGGMSGAPAGIPKAMEAMSGKPADAGIQAPGIPGSPGKPEVPPNTAVPWTNSASVAEMAKGKPEMQQQIGQQMDAMEQQFMSTYKQGDQLTPEHHQQLQKIAAGRAGLEAARQGKTPQELGAGAEQLYHKLTSDGTMDMNDMQQFLQSDASKQALKDFAAQQQPPTNPATGQPEANWSMDPQVLRQNFSAIWKSKPWQAAALMMGIPLALHGAYSAMTGGGSGGIGGLLSMVVGGGLAAFGSGAFDAGGLGGKNLFAPGAAAPAAGAAPPAGQAATPPQGPPAANAGPLVGTQAAWALANPQAAIKKIRTLLPAGSSFVVGDAEIQQFLQSYASDPKQAMQSLSGRATAEQMQQIEQWLQAKDPSVQNMGGSSAAAPIASKMPGTPNTQTMIP